MIMHIDMDAFFASIEQRVNPSLRGKPLIVTGRKDRYKSIVCAASYEAKAFGIDSGMPSWQALKLCPGAKCVAADSSKYIYTSDCIFGILKEFSPDISINSVDEFYIDCRHLAQDLLQMAKDIKSRIKEEFALTCSIGIAPTPLSSKLAAKLGKPDGLVLLGREKLKEILKDLPVENICGIGSEMKNKLNSLDIFTCGQLARVEVRLLVKNFGKLGTWLHLVSNGRDPISAVNFSAKEEVPKSVGHSQTLRRATSEPEVIRSFMYLLSEMVALRLRKLNIQGKTVTLFISSDYVTGACRQRTFSQFTYDGAEIFKRSLLLLKLFNFRHLIVRLLGVSVSNFTKSETFYLFEEDAKREKLVRNLDKINRNFGEWTIFPASLILASKT